MDPLKSFLCLKKEGYLHTTFFIHARWQVYNSVPVTAELLSGVDLVVITTDHSSYDYDLIVEQAPYVFDTRNATREIEHDREKIELL